jgi:hypothetical protein
MIGSRFRTTPRTPNPAPPRARHARTRITASAGDGRRGSARGAGAIRTDGVVRRPAGSAMPSPTLEPEGACRRCMLRANRRWPVVDARGVGRRLSVAAVRTSDAAAPAAATGRTDRGRMAPAIRGAPSGSPCTEPSGRARRTFAFEAASPEVAGIALGPGVALESAEVDVGTGSVAGGDVAAAGEGSDGPAGAAGGATADGDGEGSACGAGGDGASGAGGGLGALRGGSSPSGSTYASPSPSRIPRWTYGTACSGSPDVPEAAIGSPSATYWPRLTRSAPRWVSEALWSPTAIVTVRP